jgi:hypothetical protein
MNKKVIGIILLIIGFYFLVIYPVVTIIIVVFNIRLDFHLNYFDLWINFFWDHWWWISILIGGIGIVMIKYGRRYVLTINPESLKSDIA